MIEKLKELPFSSYNPSYEFLAGYRIFFSLYLLWAGISDNSWVPGIPKSALHAPISVLTFTDRVPPEWFFTGSSYIMYLCLLLILIGLKPRMSAIVFMGLFILTNSYAFSFGKIDHNFIYVLPVLIMAFSPWNTTYSFFKEPEKETDVLSRSWPIFLVSMVFGFGMFTAGFAKFLGGWLNTDIQYTQMFFFKYRYGLEWNDLLSDTYDKISSPFFWEMLDYFTVIFESVFIIAFLSPKYFRFMLLVTLFFHVNVLLMLNIPFTASVGLYALFIPSGLVPSGIKTRIKSFLSAVFQPKYRIWAIGFAVAYMLLVIVFNINATGYIIGNFFLLFTFSKYASAIIILGGALLFAIYLFIRSFKTADRTIARQVVREDRKW